MRSLPFISTMLLAVAFVGGPGVGPVSAQTEVQAVQQQIAQLRQDFDALTQQYGDRLTALEARLGRDSGRAGRPYIIDAVCGAATGGAGAARCRRRRRTKRDVAGLRAMPPPRRRFSIPTWRSSAIFSALPATTPSILRRRCRCTRRKRHLSGGRRSVRARRLLRRVRRRRRGARGRIHHLSVAARRVADQGWQDARGVRQGEHHAQSHPAVDRSAARHQQPRWRRGRDRRRRASRLRG